MNAFSARKEIFKLTIRQRFLFAIDFINGLFTLSKTEDATLVRYMEVYQRAISNITSREYVSWKASEDASSIYLDHIIYPDNPVDGNSILNHMNYRICTSIHSLSANLNRYKGNSDFYCSLEYIICSRTDSKLTQQILKSAVYPITFNPAWKTPETVHMAQTILETQDFALSNILADMLMDMDCPYIQDLRNGRRFSNWYLANLTS